MPRASSTAWSCRVAPDAAADSAALSGEAPGDASAGRFAAADGLARLSVSIAATDSRMRASDASEYWEVAAPRAWPKVKDGRLAVASAKRLGIAAATFAASLAA